MVATFRQATGAALLSLCLAPIALAFQGRSAIYVEAKGSGGKDLGRVCITVVPQNGNPIFEKSDRHGRVVVRNLPAGKYRVTAKIDGYVAEKKEVVLDSEQANVEFELRPKNTR